MRVFLTGGSGFIGRSLLPMLISSGNDVLCLVRDGNSVHMIDGSHYIEGSLSDLSSFDESIRSFQPEVLLHLAWEGIPNYSYQNSKINLQRSVDLVDAVLALGSCKKIIVAGTCFEYQDPEGKCSEDSFVHASDFYTWSKLALRDYLKLRCEEIGCAWYWPRLFYVYGEHQRPGALISSLIEALSRGETLVINTPDNQNDFVHVNDVGSALISLLEGEGVCGDYNIGSGRPHSVRQVCHKVAACMGRTIELDGGSLLEADAFYADIGRMQKEVGWHPSISLDDGLDNLISLHQQVSVA